MRVAGLVINLGLKSVRAIAFDDRGRKLAHAARPVQTLLKDSWIEQDPLEWWSKTVLCTQEVIERVGPDVNFLTITASSSCLLPVDADGHPLRRTIMVSDRRAAAQARRMEGLPSFAAVRATNPAFAADPYFLLPKAMWLLEMEPQVFAATRWLLTPADYLMLRITGEAVTDPLNAEKFFFHVAEQRYPDALLREAGLDPGRLPAVAAIGDVAGSVSGGAASELRVRPGTPVRVATYDAICAFWGSGVAEPGDVADVSGTVTSVRVLSDNELPPDESRVFSQCMPGVPKCVIGGSNNLGGGLIEWLKQSFYPTDDLAYNLIEQEAGESGVGARGLLFLPYLLGERCPVWDIDARGVFFGLERQHQRGDFARAVCESAAFGVEHILRTVRSFGTEMRRLRVSGGLARLALVNAIKADVTGLPVEVLEEFETTSVGAFLVAATGAGLFGSLEDAARTVQVREVVLPNEERRQRYSEWFELYLKLYETLRPLFAERQRLFDRHRLGGVGRLENL